MGQKKNFAVLLVLCGLLCTVTGCAGEVRNLNSTETGAESKVESVVSTDNEINTSEETAEKAEVSTETETTKKQEDTAFKGYVERLRKGVKDKNLCVKAKILDEDSGEVREEVVYMVNADMMGYYAKSVGTEDAYEEINVIKDGQLYVADVKEKLYFDMATSEIMGGYDDFMTSVLEEFDMMQYVGEQDGYEIFDFISKSTATYAKAREEEKQDIDAVEIVEEAIGADSIVTDEDATDGLWLEEGVLEDFETGAMPSEDFETGAMPTETKTTEYVKVDGNKLTMCNKNDGEALHVYFEMEIVDRTPAIEKLFDLTDYKPYPAYSEDVG